MSSADERRQLWDARYAADQRLWSGRVNPVLATEAATFTPGRALDAGCGEGGDAMWLAERGWSVTAIDVSTVAVERARREWTSRGDRVGTATFTRRDLTEWVPPARGFALVSAQYLHVEPAIREVVYRRLADAVAPGGVLLMVLHDRADLALDIPRPPETTMLSADELRAYADGFDSVTVEKRPRSAPGSGLVHDVVLVARR